MRKVAPTTSLPPGRNSPTRSAARSRSHSTRPRSARRATFPPRLVPLAAPAVIFTSERTEGPKRQSAILMQDSSAVAAGRPDKVASGRIASTRRMLGQGILAVASLVLLAVLLVQILRASGTTAAGFADWRPVLYAYLLWSVALGVEQVMARGQRGLRALFLLPAVLFTVAVVIFPTLFGFYIASLDWNLSSLEGPHFNGFNNLIALFHDDYYWNALGNMVFYAVAVLGEYAIAFCLALLLNAEIRGRKLFRVVFLL